MNAKENRRIYAGSFLVTEHTKPGHWVGYLDNDPLARTTARRVHGTTEAGVLKVLKAKALREADDEITREGECLLAAGML